MLLVKNVWLADSTVTQTYWNRGHGIAPTTGMRNINVIFHDAAEVIFHTQI